ncbi:MAG: extracellular solute-binding protein family 3 [Ilumatobacteraceae bacterium]|nr:extracellular solute-binding protein family 3 [Ilumatobacteraceae bacterium]
MKMRKYAAFAVAGVVVLAACGSDKKTETTTAVTTAVTTAATTSASTAATTAPTTATSGGDTTTPASGAVSSTPAGGTIDCKPVKAGVLSVVTSLPGPNFWGTTNAEVDPDAIKSGIEYDMANDIAAKCGLKMEFRNEGFDALVAGQIAADSYDIALSQVTITDDRAKVVDFSVGYFKSDQGLLVKKGTVVKTWDDVKKLKIGVQASTTAEYYFTSGEVPGWSLDGVKSYPDLSSAYAALNAGQVDGIVIDTPINLGQASQSGGKLEVVGQFKTGEEYGAIFGKGNGKKAIFDPIIQGLIDDGTVNSLIAKYLGGDPTTVPFIDVPSS